MSDRPWKIRVTPHPDTGKTSWWWTANLDILERDPARVLPFFKEVKAFLEAEHWYHTASEAKAGAENAVDEYETLAAMEIEYTYNPGKENPSED